MTAIKIITNTIAIKCLIIVEKKAIFLSLIFVLLMLSGSSQASVIIPTRYYDVVLYDISSDRSINLMKDIELTGPINFHHISNNYVAWYSRFSPDKIYINNLTDSYTKTIDSKMQINGLFLNDNELAYYNYSSLFIYNISSNKTEIMTERDPDISNAQFNNNYILFVQFTLIKSIYLYEIADGKTVKIGDGDKGLLYEDTVLYNEKVPNSNTVMINLYNISDNLTIPLYQGKGETDVIAIQSEYIAWRLENGTIYIQNRTTGEGLYILENIKHIREFSIYNELIVFEDYGAYDTSEIVLYNINTGETKRLTQTDNRHERAPKIYGDHIIWVAEHVESSGLDFNPILPTIIIILIIVVIVHKVKRKKSA